MKRKDVSYPVCFLLTRLIKVYIKRENLQILRRQSMIINNKNINIVTKQNDYQVASGAKITCAKFGAANF